MTSSESMLNDVFNVSNVNSILDCPNGSTAKIDKIRNMNISEKLTLFDVFVILDFNVNLLSVHKLCKDSKCKVLFDKYNYTRWDSQSMEIVETSNEGGGLYYFSSIPLGKPSNNSSVIKCFVSKLTWHRRLSHPPKKVLIALKDKLNFINNSLPPSEICHKAKQTSEIFPTIIYSYKNIGDIIYHDVCGAYKVVVIGGFRFL